MPRHKLFVKFEFEISLLFVVAYIALLDDLLVYDSIEAGQSLMSFTISFLSESFAALSALERSIVPVSPQMVHHVANFGEVSLTETTNENLIHPFGLLVVHSPS
jgi:hypothetical protein